MFEKTLIFNNACYNLKLVVLYSKMCKQAILSSLKNEISTKMEIHAIFEIEFLYKLIRLMDRLTTYELVKKTVYFYEAKSSSY